MRLDEKGSEAVPHEKVILLHVLPGSCTFQRGINVKHN